MTVGSSIDFRQALRDRLTQARAHTDTLFDVVRRDARYDRPIPERHRIVFYIGHLEAFDWNLIARTALGIEAFDAKLDRLFAFGIDPVDGGLPSDQPSEWPALEVVADYGHRVRQMIDDAVERVQGDDPRLGLLEGGTAFHVAIEHRLMHAETLAYMLHRLPLDRKVAPALREMPGAATPRSSSITIPAGRATLGLERSKGFGWDNEYDRHTVAVPGFEIDALKVTNRHLLEFIDAGGYAKRELWTDADWAWKEASALRHPSFWCADGDRWLYRGMLTELPLPFDAPAYVSQAEASAYARWKGKRLPTEAEFHRAAYGTREGAERTYPWGEAAPDPTRGNFDFHHWDPVSVGSTPAGDSAFGVSELVGNGWEWTATEFAPFQGFEPFPFYAGYSANFFDGKHYVMKGGSPRTAACMLRPSFRNWFQAHYPYAYTGFRCVAN